MADQDVFFEISSLFKTFLKGVSQKWDKQGYRLSITHFKALYVLSKEGPLILSKLAAALDMTPPAITGITDQLLAENFIRKERAEGDRRVVNITLTEEGKAMINEVQDKQQKVMQSYFSVLPSEDIDHLRRIFAVLTAELDKK